MKPTASEPFLGTSTPPDYCTSLLEEISNALDYKLLATPATETPPVLPSSDYSKPHEASVSKRASCGHPLPFPGMGDKLIPEFDYSRRQSQTPDYLSGAGPDLSLKLERPNSICTTHALSTVEDTPPLSISKKRHSLNFWSRHKRTNSSTVTFTTDAAPKRGSRLFSRAK